MRELRFAVPPARRIPIYEDLIGRLAASLREGTDGCEAARAYIGFLRGLLVEAQQQAAGD